MPDSHFTHKFIYASIRKFLGSNILHEQAARVTSRDDDEKTTKKDSCGRDSGKKIVFKCTQH